MTVRAVCLDLLSALLDSGSVWDAAAADSGAAGLGRSWRRRYLALTAAAGPYRPYLDLVAEAARDAGLPAAATGALERRWGDLEPWPDVAPALLPLQVPLAVVTNCSEALGRLAATRVRVPFALVVTAERAGAYKPDPAPYRLACDELGCAPAEVAFVAGSPFDARGALAHGFRVTWVNRLGDSLPGDGAALRLVSSLAGWTPDGARSENRG